MSRTEGYLRFLMAITILVAAVWIDAQTLMTMVITFAVAGVIITGYHAVLPDWPDLKRTVLDAVGEGEIIDTSARIEPTLNHDDGGDDDGEAIEADAEPTPIRAGKRR